MAVKSLPVVGRGLSADHWLFVLKEVESFLNHVKRTTRAASVGLPSGARPYRDEVICDQLNQHPQHQFVKGSSEPWVANTGSYSSSLRLIVRKNSVVIDIIFTTLTSFSPYYPLPFASRNLLSYPLLTTVLYYTPFICGLLYGRNKQKKYKKV